MKLLPISTIKSFITIVDSGSMQKASEKEALTQSALSLRIARLEEIVQQPLFIRASARLTLTPAGETLLAFGRKMLDLNNRTVAALSAEFSTAPARIGIVQDFAEPLLENVLGRIGSRFPQSLLRIKHGSTQAMLGSYRDGELDIVVGLGEARDPRCVRALDLRWMGDLALLDQEVLPIAILEPPCLFREKALESLADAQRAYRIVLEAPCVSTLRAAVGSGLALTARTRLFGPGLPLIDPQRLPPLPQVGCIVVHNGSSALVRQLGRLLRDALVQPRLAEDAAEGCPIGEALLEAAE